jgi:hypothetical protein
MALKRVAIPSPNYSSRGGTAVRLVVLHTAEGARTYQSLGSFFQNPSSGVSSHVGIDDTPGTVGEYVPPGMKAWTQANANPYSVAAELCAFAAWSPAEWGGHGVMLQNTAAWVAEECARFGIPVRRLNASQAQGGQAGVCQHVDLGAAGGNHWDCGPGFPMDDVIRMAAGGSPSPGPQPQEEENNMVFSDPKTKGTWVAKRSGAVHTIGPAPYLGGCNNSKYNPGNKPCVGISDNNGDGYRLVLDFGGDDYREYSFPRDGSAWVR